MNAGIRKSLGIVRKDQSGITGLETAIVLIAFVVVASVFAYAMITTGVFTGEEAVSSAQAGVNTANSTMVPKGSTVLTEARSNGTDSLSVNATFLSDAANGAFIVEGVVTGDAIRNVTDGSACTVSVVTATTVTCVSPLTGGTDNDWDSGDAYEIDMDQVSTVKFKVTSAPGADAFSLAPVTTLVSFIDANNYLNATYLATIPFGGGADPFATANTGYWTHNWLVGTGPGIETGELVEFTLNIKNLAIPLSSNSSFSVEIVPQAGAALSVSRTTPLELATVMKLN